MRWEPKCRALFFALIAVFFLVPIASADACNHNGEVCAGNSQCCSSDCQGVCICAPEGHTCQSGPINDCCSGRCVGGECSPQPPAPVSGGIWDNLYGWMALAVAISTAILALAYMAGKLFELQVLEAWVKIEMSELVTSFIIALFCVAMIVTANSAAQFLSGEGATVNVIFAARDFLANHVYADGRELYLRLSVAYFHIARIASYSYTYGLNYGNVITSGMSESPAAGLSPLVAEVGQGMDSVSNFMLLAAAQGAFLLFFSSAAQIMLPIGVFLRSFSFTRKIGAMLLAAVIASSVVYPAALLVSREIYNNYRGVQTQQILPGPWPIIVNSYSPGSLRDMTSKISVADSGSPPKSGIVCNDAMQVFVMSPIPFVGGELGWYIVSCLWWCVPAGGSACTVCWNIIYWTFITIKSLFPMILYYGVLGPFASNLGDWNFIAPNYYDVMYNYALPAISMYAVLSLVVFLIPVIIAITLMRNFTILFGGEPQFYGLSKLV